MHPVSLLQAIILGVIQGATEFLPVSSTAHMRVIPALLQWGDPGSAFSAVVQLGPIVAIIWYYRVKLLAYLKGMGRSLGAGKLFPEGDLEARLGWYTAFGTIPLVVAALALEKKVDSEYRNLYVVGGALILLALILLWAEKVSKRTMTLSELPFGKAMGIGLAQVVALLPGASRSGSTIAAGL
ncbi:MAG TPA: undecaprenyl-diphosphate phosphatase, partial [Fimbriimonadaceae bacterium]|nr:undecaprenyl-diphosphate phosphatase [Fimbriimonadaceae bacterium]